LQDYNTINLRPL